jgi:hypothetical protein
MSINTRSLNFGISDYNSGFALVAPSHFTMDIAGASVLDVTSSLLTPAVKVLHTNSAVSQLTSTVTGVTSSTQATTITMFGVAPHATTGVTFKFTNALILATSVVVASIGVPAQNSLDVGSYLIVNVNNIAAGSCYLEVYNFGASDTTALPVIQVYIAC